VAENRDVFLDGVSALITAAICARKSTDPSAVADDAKRVPRQIADATAYATPKDWRVPEACIFVDDGISGAEFANRPGFMRLLNALASRGVFGRPPARSRVVASRVKPLRKGALGERRARTEPRYRSRW
jgi:hypothetical protein